MAKKTPIPDTKNKSGIRHILSIAMGIHNDSHGFLFAMNPIIVPQD
jgi:hypothetical protein